MRIAVIGTGAVGQAISGKLAELGHEVVVGTRDVASTQAREGDAPWDQESPSIRLVSFADAAAHADVVINATSGNVSLDALRAVGAASLANKVLVDVSNPLDFSQGFPPTLFVMDTDSLAEQIQAAFPDAKVVKALNTMTADVMVNPRQLANGDHSVFVCGNDSSAKDVVTALLVEMGHTDVIDLGDLSSARGTEMYLPLWLRLMGAVGQPIFNIKVVR